MDFTRECHASGEAANYERHPKQVSLLAGYERSDRISQNLSGDGGVIEDKMASIRKYRCVDLLFEFPCHTSAQFSGLRERVF